MKRMALEISSEAIRTLCAENRIRRLAVFGSALRDDSGPASDVDMLIEFEPGESVGFFRLARVQDDLSALFGRRVDLNTFKMLSPHFRDEVLAEAETLYVAA